MAIKSIHIYNLLFSAKSILHNAQKVHNGLIILAGSVQLQVSYVSFVLILDSCANMKSAISYRITSVWRDQFVGVLGLPNLCVQLVGVTLYKDKSVGLISELDENGVIINTQIMTWPVAVTFQDVASTTTGNRIYVGYSGKGETI